MRASLLLMLGAAACTTVSGSAGSFVLTSNVDYHAPPVAYLVGNGRVTSESLYVELKGDCVRGTMASEPLDLCSAEPAADGTQTWQGSSGQVAIQPVEGGKAFKVSGYITLSAGLSFDVTQTLRLPQGKTSDELRAQPVLLLIATTATDLQAMRRRRPL